MHLKHSHSHANSSHASIVLLRVIMITLFFMAIELIGGWYANSLALISDGVHMLTDVGAMFLSLFAIWVARRPITTTMSFGYHRAEILGALASGFLIWLIAGVLVYEAIVRLKAPPPVQGGVVFVIAAMGLVANLLSMGMLRTARKENINVRAAYLHLLADSLGSVSAVIAGAVLWFTNWKWIDPIVTLFFSILMLYGSWSLVKEAIAVLMESTPSSINPEVVKRELENISGVQEVHDLHIWSVSSYKWALSVHLISEDSSGQLLQNSNLMLKERYGIIHTTIQVEHPARFVSERCYDCAPTTT